MYNNVNHMSNIVIKLFNVSSNIRKRRGKCYFKYKEKPYDSYL